VISAENFCGILQRKIGYITDDVDGDVTRKSDFSRTFFALDVLDADIVTL
jgi:hypothetical protein